MGFGLRVSLALSALIFAAMPALLQAQMHKPGMPMNKPDMQMQHADMQLFHYLLAHRGEITREVKNLPNGIDTLTRSHNPEVAAKLKAHVASMVARMEEGRPIHARDPLFAELFRNAKRVKVMLEPFEAGVHVIETSDDDYTVKLLHEHARVVNLFIKNGMEEMHRDHAVSKPIPPASR